MFISLTTSPQYEYISQDCGRNMGARIRSDEQADEILKKEAAWSKRWTWICGLSAVSMVALCNLSGQNTHALVLCKLLAAIGFCVSLYMTLALRERSLAEPLSHHQQLCQQPATLASRSPAVKDYVRKVNESGRQLRVFDIACANGVYAKECSELSPPAETSCAVLHSI